MRSRASSCCCLLDNCEHLVDACAELAEALLRACPLLTILATSRQPIRLTGEIAWRVPSLSLPSSEDTSSDAADVSESVQLFVQRASASMRTFALTSANRDAILEICHRLDGIPLAIELAAAWVGTLSPKQINERLENPFWLLNRAGRDVPVRHQTLQATVEWSYSLLDVQEKRLFERLSVFAGGWTLEAAEAVTTDEAIPSSTVLGLLANLVDKSLVLAEQQVGKPRYRLLEPLRQYAASRLGEAGETTSVRDRHRDWYRNLAESAEWELWGPDQHVSAAARGRTRQFAGGAHLESDCGFGSRSWIATGCSAMAVLGYPQLPQRGWSVACSAARDAGGSGLYASPG